MKIATILLAAALIAQAAGTALAQRSATSKILGTAYDGWSSGMYQDHAYDHAYVLQSYASAGQSVPQEVAARHVAAIRSNLTAAGKSIDSLTKATEGDSTAAKHLAAMKAHHAKALAQCDMIDKECTKGEGDSKAVHKCCTSAADSLKAAQAEHEKLMTHLKVQKPGAAKAAE